MPALRLFGRRWLLAGDDVPAPAAFLATFHLIWLIILSVWIADFNGRGEQCTGIGPCNVAMGGLLASFTLSCLLEASAVVVGFRGTMFETRKRAALPFIIYANTAFMFAQVGFNGYATYRVTARPPTCYATSWDPAVAMQGIVWSTWAVIAGVCFLVVVAYNLFPNYKDPKEWERQCECLAIACCGPRCSFFGKSRRNSTTGDASKRLGALFALMFSHIDLTPTDVIGAFGLVLLCHRSRRRKRPNSGPVHSPQRSESGGAFSLGGAGKEEAAKNSNPVTPLERPSPVGSQDALLTEGDADNRHRSSNNAPSTSSSSSATNKPDAQTLQDAAHYMKYAFAAYGWMLFVWERKAKGFMQLCCGRACGLWTSAVTQRRRFYHGEGLGLALPPPLPLQAPQINREAILQAAHIRESDLLHVHLEAHENPNVLPYYVAADHEKKAIVIAVRGSLSLNDVVRDLLFEPADLDEWAGDDPTLPQWGAPLPGLRPAGRMTRYAAHSGIFEAARATLDDIRKGGVLDALLFGEDKATEDHKSKRKKGRRPTGSQRSWADYNLIVCGHSLGAGCAFLMSIYLRKYFPRLQCWAFSPPGGLATSALCAEACEWCTSVVCGREMIPRLTLLTFERLRDDIVLSAVRSKKPKLSLFLGWLARRRWGEDDVLYAVEDVPHEPKTWLLNYQESLEESKSRREYVETAGQFGPPGRVLYLKYLGKEAVNGESDGSWLSILGWCRVPAPSPAVRRYDPIWIDGSQLVESGLLVSSRMMADHMPDYSLAVLRRMAEWASSQEDNVPYAQRDLGVDVSDSAGEVEMRHRVVVVEANKTTPDVENEDSMV